MADTTARRSARPDALPPFHSPLATVLLADWSRLRTSPVVVRHLRSWPLPEAPGVDPSALLEHVLGLTGFLGVGDPTTTDRFLLQLVDRARHDELAARIVLQRLLPALVAVARRRGRQHRGAQHAFDELVATAWIAIRTYPVERRPAKVAANLVRDVEYLTFVRPRRLRSAQEQVGLPEVPPIRAGLQGTAIELEPSSREQLGELLTLARRAGLEEADLAFAGAWAAGADTRALADRFGICERSVRNRRRQVVHRLRQVAEAVAVA